MKLFTVYVRSPGAMQMGLTKLFSTVEPTKHNTGYHPDSSPYVYAMKKVEELLILDESIIKKSKND